MTGEALVGAAASELVWDTATRGTAVTATGGSMSVAGPDGWSAETILATSIGASIMSHFLTLATSAQIEVLGYVSRQSAAPPDESGVRRIEVSACIVTSTDEGAAHAGRLFDAAVKNAAVVQALQVPPTAEVRISVLRDRRDSLNLPTRRAQLC